MTEADALAYLNSRSEVRRLLQNATIREVLKAYFGAEYDPCTMTYTFPGGITVSLLEVTKHERSWIELAIELEVPYGPFEA